MYKQSKKKLYHLNVNKSTHRRKITSLGICGWGCLKKRQTIGGMKGNQKYVALGYYIGCQDREMRRGNYY